MPDKAARRAPLLRGALLLVSFFILFALILSPLFSGENGEKLTLLEYADQVFNELSKGSSWFIPGLRERLPDFENASVTAEFRAPADADTTRIMRMLVQRCGGTVYLREDSFSYVAPLAPLLAQALDLSEALYDNDGEKAAAKYGLPWEETARAWHGLLAPTVRELQQVDKVEEAKFVNDVVIKAIEPAYNFYGIEPAGMSGHIMLVSALLAFYLLYTLWYGFGIMAIFEGLGLLSGEAKEE